MLLSISSRAQSASEIFKQAMVAFENGSNGSCINYLLNCESILGKTNPKIESLRALAYNASGDWTKASIALKTYFKIAPSSNIGTPAYKDLLAINEKVEAQIKLADKEFIEKRDEKRMAPADEIVKQRSNAEESKQRQLKLISDKKIFDIYKESNDPKELQEFVKMYPASPEVNNITFKQLVLEGDQKVANQDWRKAIDKYSEALQIKDNEKVEEKRAIAWDELTYENAEILSADVGPMERYLDKYPLGLHVGQAEEYLKKEYLERARAARGKDFATAELFYKRYQERFPRGSKIKTVDAELCSLYYNEGKKYEKSKNISDISMAIQLFTNANNCGKKTSDRKMASLKRKERKGYRYDDSFWGWHADEKNLYGLMFGGLKNKKIGIYISARVGNGIFESTTYWETNNDNSVAKSNDLKKTFTGTITSKSIYGNFGITKKVFHPVWLYAGAGVCVNSELRQFEHNITHEKEFAENADKKFTALNVEAGIYLRLAGIVFRYGVNRPMNDKFTGSIVHHFGLGFAF
jgi:hypothetical protein